MPPDKKPESIDISTAHTEPKQFIRTFESDSAAVRQGSKPGFNEVEAPPEPVVNEPLPPPPPRPVPELRAEPVEPTTPASSRLVEGSIFPAFTPKEEAPMVAPAPPPLPVTPDKAPIRTYTSDFATKIKDEKASTASVLAAEGDASKKSVRQTTSFNVPLIAGGVILIVLGLGGAYATYTYLNAPQTVQIAPEIATPIFVNEREQISGGGTDLIAAITTSLQKPLASGSVRFLYTALATTTGNDVFHALDLPAPNILLRNINAQGSMAGIVHTDTPASPFFILSVSSYGDTFAGMLAWEPRMASDLKNIFPLSATTTLAFRDEILSNHDVRVLRDVTHQSLIIYGYWDPKTLLIARDESAYNELLKRLATSRTTH